MYIWIMLATIMIALSFFNLSPRPDKEDTFVKVKATSVATRFRIEHNAFIRVADCKIKNAISTVDVTGMVLSNTISGSETSVTCQGYGSDTDCAMFENNLPIGYQKGADLNTYHYVYCLNGNLLEGGNPISAACSSSDATHRYAISVARVPNRWMSKGAADQSPLPVLSTAVADQYLKGTILGIIGCYSIDEESVDKTIKECSFQGAQSYIKINESGEREKSLPSFKNDNSGFYKDFFWSLRDICGGASCFFAVTELHGNYCRNTSTPGS